MYFLRLSHQRTKMSTCLYHYPHDCLKRSDDVTKIETILDKAQTIAIKSSGHKLIFSSCDKEILRPAFLKSCQNKIGPLSK